VSTSDLAIVAALVFAWGTLSARLERFDVTAPITFVVAGLLLLTHGPLAVLSAAPSNKLIKELAEFTLALVLFSDASPVKLHELRADAALYLRLLGVALPLTIGLGTLLALALASNASIWLALLVGAALAPTDAALGAGMMTNPAVPARIRRLINVEAAPTTGSSRSGTPPAMDGAANAPCTRTGSSPTPAAGTSQAPIPTSARTGRSGSTASQTPEPCPARSSHPQLVLGCHPAEHVQSGKLADHFGVGQVLQFGAGEHAGPTARAGSDAVPRR
jgi:Sodium/hydrogen exchanger family